MAKRKASYTGEQTSLWLSRIARGMQKHGQTVFLIENLQPTWLQQRWMVMVYRLVTRISDGFVAAFGFLFLIFGVEGSQPDLPGFFLGAKEALAAGIFSAIVLLWVDFFLLRVRPILAYASTPLPRERFFFLFVRAVIAISLTLGPTLVVSGLLVREKGVYLEIVGLAELSALYFGLSRGNLGKLRFRTDMLDVSSVEKLTWSWPHVLRGTAGAGAIGAVVYFSIYKLLSFLQGFPVSLSRVPIFGLLLLLPLFWIFRVSTVEGKLVPNAGMRISLRNALSAFWRSAILGMLLAAGIAFALPTIEVNPAAILQAGLAYGLLASAWYGGADVLRHYTIRYLLSRNNYLPRDFAAFLNFCADELHILQRVGGGYMFLHRFLLEYFAGLGEGTEGTPATTPELPGVVAS